LVELKDVTWLKNNNINEDRLIELQCQIVKSEKETKAKVENFICDKAQGSNAIVYKQRKTMLDYALQTKIRSVALCHVKVILFLPE
jgi:hypothetical protein